MRKEVMKNIIIEKLVEAQILPEEAVCALTPAGFPLTSPEASPVQNSKPTSKEMSLENLFELEKLKLEYKLRMVEAEREERQLQIQKEIKLAELESEEKRAQAELELRRLQVSEEQDRRNNEQVQQPAKHGIYHCIKTSGPPVFSKFRRLAPDKLVVAEQTFAELERLDICQKASSPWASPLHIVTKKDGTLRPCGD
ncbi:hypothetical protein Pcinc_012980 [Petrolisthes cinctipes]|uniref:Uncharacterized protein n=1 Tax=Petrolisthes cinctipes TaxID=88211 RepID=A0AAE1FXX7_PETCI|nr:hypothetical protein Pcinc_012980 [Petrolisthes cinctipes]